MIWKPHCNNLQIYDISCNLDYSKCRCLYNICIISSIFTSYLTISQPILHLCPHNTTTIILWQTSTIRNSRNTSGSATVAFLQITAHTCKIQIPHNQIINFYQHARWAQIEATARANVPQRCLEQGFARAVICRNAAPGQATASSGRDTEVA